MKKHELQNAYIAKGIIFLLLVFIIFLLLLTDTNRNFKDNYNVNL